MVPKLMTSTNRVTTALAYGKEKTQECRNSQENRTGHRHQWKEYYF